MRQRGHQAVGLLLLLPRGAGGFLHHGEVLLRDEVQMSDGLADLLDTAGLLARSIRNIGHDVLHLLNRPDDVPHGVARAFHQVGAGIQLADRLADQGVDVLGGVGGAQGQVAHFRCDHGESLAVLARARRLDGGIQGQNIRLERDRIDQSGDVGDFPRIPAYVLHGLCGILYGLAALHGAGAGLVHQLFRLLGVIGVIVYGCSQLLHGRGGLLQIGGLLIGPLR